MKKAKEILVKNGRGGKRKGAGRKPGNPPMMERYFLRVPQDLHRWLNHIGPDAVRTILELEKGIENDKSIKDVA